MLGPLPDAPLSFSPQVHESEHKVILDQRACSSMTRNVKEIWPRNVCSHRTLLCASVIVATIRGSDAAVMSCIDFPTYPGGCNPDFVGGACFSRQFGVNWACGVYPGSDCRKVPVPPGQGRLSLRGRTYDGYCTFGETATQTTSSATSITATSSTATSSTATSVTTTQTSSTSTSLTTSATSTSSSVTLTTSSTATRTTTMPHAPLGSPVAEHGHLRVVGNQIVGEHNQSVQLHGMSLFWSQWGGAYWNEETLEWLRRDWGIELIRAAMGVEPGGYLLHPKQEMRKVKRMVWAAFQLGIYVIVDWHDHHATQNIQQAKAFFHEIAKSYGHLPNVLLETFNEPTWQSWSKDVKPYHEEILKVIRPHSSNIVICGTPTWSQDVDVASALPVEGENIAYTLHFYAATHGQYLRDKAKIALDRGVALFVSEWGTCEANGNGKLDLRETERWMEFLDEYNVSDANWAVNDKRESCSALKPGAASNGHWPRSKLTRSGRWVRSYLRQAAFGIDNETANSTNSSLDEDFLISTSEADRRLHFSYDLPIDAGVRCHVFAMSVLGLLQVLWRI